MSIAGKRVNPWRAVDGEGEVSDIPIQSRRNKNAGFKLKKHGFVPDTFITEKLPFHDASLKHPGPAKHHDFCARKNNSNLPVRQQERRMQRFRSVRSAQWLDTFNGQYHLNFRKSLRQFHNHAAGRRQTVTVTT